MKNISVLKKNIDLLRKQKDKNGLKNQIDLVSGLIKDYELNEINIQSSDPNFISKVKVKNQIWRDKEIDLADIEWGWSIFWVGHKGNMAFPMVRDMCNTQWENPCSLIEEATSRRFSIIKLLRAAVYQYEKLTCWQLSKDLNSEGYATLHKPVNFRSINLCLELYPENMIFGKHLY